jgi:hypothetical protein
MIEGAISNIKDEMLSIPRFIMSVHYFIPRGMPVTADIGGAAFGSLSVQRQVAADEFNLNNAY